MRKIAVISDIHSNIEALETVMTEIWDNGIEEIYCLGDIVGYNTFPNEVCEYLQKAQVKCILGNHDADVLAQKFNSAKTPDIFEWTYNALTEENRQWLGSLPLSLEIQAETQKLLLVHGSPDSIEEYCFMGSKEAARVMRETTADIMFCGHTHAPSISYYGPKALMNPGSVGKPKNGSPKAQWLEISIFNALLNPLLKTIEYDAEKTASENDKHGFTKYAEQLRTGVVA